MKKIIGLMVTIGMLVGGVVIASALDSVLVWSNAPGTPPYAVQVEKSSNIAGTYTIIKTTAVSAVTYTDSNNVAGDTACYRIAYSNASGIGPYAGPLCKTFPTVPTQTPATFGVN